VSEPYTPRNLLDRLSDPATLEVQYERMRQRESEILGAHLPLADGDVLSVGCGRQPGRHLFPAPAFRMTGVELDAALVEELEERGEIDEGLTGRAGELPLPDASFDVVLYRLVLHHVVFQGPLAPVFAEARRLLRPGGALVAVEPGAWHPVGAALALANRAGLATAIHGTPDDIPLSPRRLEAEARAAGLSPELHAVTYSWRRLPAGAQRALQRLDRYGSRRGMRSLGHTLMLIARVG
jgi:SAM-dependent methyltransferase